jgi:uncharacterized protein YeaO (DUF488 family)
MNPGRTLDAHRTTEPLSATGAGIEIKSVREPPLTSDGKRILVNRLWPRDITRQQAAVDEWRPDWAPSGPLRRSFDTLEDRWPEFCKRYKQELLRRGKMGELCALAERAKVERLTLVFTDPNRERNVASALLAFISEG